MKVEPKIIVDRDVSLLEALQLLETTGEGILLFRDAGQVVVGILTDPDIRRLLIKGVELSAPAREHMKREFISWVEGEHDENPITFIRHKRIRHLPVLDRDRRLVDLVSLDHYEFDGLPNPVVLMAGGLGTRLRPYTEKCPKPLLELNGKPILERILERFLESGFNNFYISVNFLGEMIEEEFGDGSKWGCKIEYLREKEKLGTAGALSLLPERPELPVVVANGDVLTNVDLRHLVDYHNRHEADATMCVRTYEVQVPFGVVDVADGRINTIVEKPVENYYVNAGIYCLSPTALDRIQPAERLDMPTLFDRIKADDGPVFAFPIHEEWMDVGRKKDLESARQKF